MNTFIGSALAFVGLGAFFNNEKLEDFFAQDDVLGEKTLAELKKKVVITSFELDGLAKQTGRRTWKPKIFHNLGLPDDPDYQQKAREVAVRTGAAPIFFPIVDGFVDGGVFANNPAMCAVTQVCDAFRRRAKGSRKRIPTIQGVLDDIKVLSIGVGQTQEYVSVGNANWGYFNWMFNPLDPLLLVNMLLQGDEMAVNFQVDHLLPEGNYHRLSPFYDRKSPIPFSVNIEEMKKTVASDQSQALIDETIAWIDQSGWLDEGNMASQQGQPASDDKQKT